MTDFDEEGDDAREHFVSKVEHPPCLGCGGEVDALDWEANYIIEVDGAKGRGCSQCYLRIARGVNPALPVFAGKIGNMKKRKK